MSVTIYPDGSIGWRGVEFRGGATVIAGMPFYVGVAWEVVDSP